MLEAINQDIIIICKGKLIAMKQDLLNRIRNLKSEFAMLDKISGDEIDQTVAHVSENQYLIIQDRIRNQLLEIEFALARIENGTFGICEETSEPIETERLMAIPYTRLCIEGAEIREMHAKKFAR